MREAQGQGRSRTWSFAKDILLVSLVLTVAMGLAFAATWMSRPAAQAAFDFSLNVPALSGSVAPGGSVTTTVTANASSTSTREVLFSCAKLPRGMSCSFTPPSCRPTCSADLVFLTSPDTPLGTHVVTVAAFDGTISRITTVQVNLSAPPPPPSFDFSLAVNPATGSVVSGGNVSAEVTATLASGSTHAVQFSCSNLPPRITCAFVPPSCDPTCSTTMRLTTAANAPAGTHSINVIASDGSLSRTVPYALTVQGPGRVRTLAFQEGDGGPFSETYDATISNSNPDGNYGADPLLMVDNGTCFEVGEVCRGLLSFPHAVGPNEGQIPLNSTIVSASFVLNVENHGPSQQMAQVLEAWTEATVTWNAFATPGAPRTKGPTITFDTAWGAFVVNITDIVQNWVNGDPNYGVFLRTDSVDGTHYHSSESDRPPKLTVTFRAVGPPMAESGSLFSPDAPSPTSTPSAANGGFEIVAGFALIATAIPALRRSRA